MENYLSETEFLNFSHEDVIAFNQKAQFSEYATKELALYYLVRDSFLYDPYHLDLRPKSLKASVITEKNRAWCVEKSILLASLMRLNNIPSRLGFAIVKNHVGVEKLYKYLKKEEIVFHGYCEVFINDKWIKCTPAFDKRICRISKVEPLDWDGKTDSLFQEFTNSEKETQFMEYLHDYGTFDDVPVELMNAEMKKHYPHLFAEEFNSKEFSFFHM